MHRLVLGKDDIPLGAFATVRLDTNSVEFGLIIPEREEMPFLLVHGDGNSVTVLPLSGKFAFRHFTLQIGSPIRGVVFREIEIAVDFQSKFDPRSKEVLGALLFEDGKVVIAASPSNDNFADVVNLPLPIQAAASDDAPVAFAKWSIASRFNAGLIELWKNEKASEAGAFSKAPL